MWGLKEGESEGRGEEEITLRPDVILARSSRRVNSVDFPSCISPVEIHSEAEAGAVGGINFSGHFGLWRGLFPETQPCDGSWPVGPGSGSDLGINSRKNMEKFTVGDCGAAAIPNLRFKIKMWKGEPESDNFRSLPEDK